MRRLNLIGLWIVLAAVGTPISAGAQDGERGRLPASQTQSTPGAAAAPAVRLYPAVVVSDSVAAYAQPNYAAPVLAWLKKGDKLDVISQTPAWYRVRIIQGGGRETSGWVEKSGIHLGTKLDTGGQAEASSERPELKRQETHARIFSGPAINVGYIYNIHHFGTYQIRTGAEYDFPLSENWGLGIPVSLSFGGGFKSIQPGAVVLWRFLAEEPWGAFARAGVFYDHFFGHGRSFESIALDLGIGGQYRPAEWLVLELEGASLEYNPITTHRVPSFIRGQALARVRFAW
ncbi:MAG: SH3 domain-containing protein [Pseudomonadota bacterium]